MNKKSSRLIIFLIVFIDLVGFGVVIPMLPLYARSFGASATDLGWLMAIYSLLQIFVSPLWGQLSDRFGRRPILLVTILGQAGAFLWGGLATSFTTLLLSRGLAGIFAGNISTASAYMADITKPEDRAKGMGLIGAAFGLGFIFGPAIGGILVQHSLAWPALFSAAMGFANFILAFIILAESNPSSLERSKNRRRVSFEAYREAVQNIRLRSIVPLFFLTTLAFVQLEITFVLFVSDRFQLTGQDAGFLLAGMGIVMAIVQGGGIGRLVQWLGEAKLIGAGLLLACAGLLAVILSDSMGHLILGLAVVGIGYSLINPCLSAMASKAVAQERQGAVLGIYQSAGSLARVFGPPLAGFLYDQAMPGAFMGAFIILFAAYFIYLFSKI